MMDWKQLRENAYEKLRPYCRVCRICDGNACAGEIPGMGGTGTGSSFQNNLRALAKYRLNLRTIHEAKEPKLAWSFLGHELPAPCMAAPLTALAMQTGGQMQDAQWAQDVAKACREVGTVAWSGDGPAQELFPSGLEAMRQNACLGIPVVKPRQNQEILRYMKRAEEAGALAVGIDLDAAGIINMKLKGQPVEPKRKDDLRQIVESLSIPVICKGIMTEDEAHLAAEAGAAAIVVSNHGGRVLDHTPGTADVLPSIAAAVSGKTIVLVDGGIRSGTDVLKMLALGADGVLIGRPLLLGGAGGGAAGVAYVLRKIMEELRVAMVLTGCETVEKINDRVLYKKQYNEDHE